MSAFKLTLSGMILCMLCEVTLLWGRIWTFWAPEWAFTWDESKSPEWVRRCWARCPFWAEAYVQRGHLKGFSPVWVRRCCERWPLCACFVSMKNRGVVTLGTFKGLLRSMGSHMLDQMALQVGSIGTTWALEGLVNKNYGSGLRRRRGERLEWNQVRTCSLSL